MAPPRFFLGLSLCAALADGRGRRRPQLQVPPLLGLFWWTGLQWRPPCLRNEAKNAGYRVFQKLIEA